MMMTTMTTTTITNSDDSELALEDQHVSLAQEMEAADIEIPVTSTEPLSIPAMLCDDKLLEEINSIPDRMGFKIGDVADILGIKQYVLLYL